MVNGDINSNEMLTEIPQAQVGTTKKKLGRKCSVTILSMVIGILTVVSSFISNNSSDIVAIAGLLIVVISDISYVIAESKLDLESIKKVVGDVQQIVDIASELDLPCCNKEDAENDYEKLDDPDSGERRDSSGYET